MFDQNILSFSHSTIVDSLQYHPVGQLFLFDFCTIFTFNFIVVLLRLLDISIYVYSVLPFEKIKKVKLSHIDVITLS